MQKRVFAQKIDSQCATVFCRQSHTANYTNMQQRICKNVFSLTNCDIWLATVF